MANRKRREVGPGRGGNYNVLRAMEGTVGAPPLTRVRDSAEGKDVQSVVIRVDAEFADKVKRLAARTRRTVTSITRELAESL